MAQIKYKRLTRTRARSGFAVAVMSRTSLWLGDDHLLFVDFSSYVETYKRFYFRDIQAVTMQQTNRGRIWNFVLGTALAFALVATLATKPAGSPANWSGDELAGGIFLGTIAVIIIVLLLINILFGPTCRTFLRTAVQTEELSSLSRVRRTRKILKKIHPLIAEAQGRLTAEEIAAQMQEPVEPDPSQSENAPP